MGLRLVVLGMMGRCPFGGQTWLYLNWLRGLSRLGHDVWYVEDDSVWPYDPSRNTVSDDCAYAVRHIAECTRAIGLPDRWAFRLAGMEGACWGLGSRDIDELYRSCDALLNIVGATDLREEQLRAPLRVYVRDRSRHGRARARRRRRAHAGTRLRRITRSPATVRTMGARDCGVPLCNGIAYVATRQPIDLELWPMALRRQHARGVSRRSATIARRGATSTYRRRDVSTGASICEWEKFVALPSRTLAAVRTGAARSLCWCYQAYLERHGSAREARPYEMSLYPVGCYPGLHPSVPALESTVAKDQNVRLRSGWFSERDACYLATGKPAVAQKRPSAMSFQWARVCSPSRPRRTRRERRWRR